MAKISTYPFPLPPNYGDWLLGTDVNDSYNTRNFKITDVLTLTNRGNFYDTTNQTAAAINTAYPIKLNNTDLSISYGFSVANNTSGNPTRITAGNDGNYNLAFSAQIYKPGGGECVVDIWIRVNGVDVPNSNTSVTLKANANYVVAAWNFFVKLNATQYVELMWATTDTNAQLSYAVSNSVHPATPSVIATINQV